MEHRGSARSLPVSGMGVKPENLRGHMVEGWFLFPLEQLKLSPCAFSTSCPHHPLLCVEQDTDSWHRGHIRDFSWLVPLEGGRRELDCGGKMREEKWLAGKQPKRLVEACRGSSSRVAKGII